jgi:hypothetical protein
MVFGKRNASFRLQQGSSNAGSGSILTIPGTKGLAQALLSGGLFLSPTKGPDFANLGRSAMGFEKLRHYHLSTRMGGDPQRTRNCKNYDLAVFNAASMFPQPSARLGRFGHSRGHGFGSAAPNLPTPRCALRYET